MTNTKVKQPLPFWKTEHGLSFVNFLWLQGAPEPTIPIFFFFFFFLAHLTSSQRPMFLLLLQYFRNLALLTSPSWRAGDENKRVSEVADLQTPDDDVSL